MHNYRLLELSDLGNCRLTVLSLNLTVLVYTDVKKSKGDEWINYTEYRVLQNWCGLVNLDILGNNLGLVDRVTKILLLRSFCIEFCYWNDRVELYLYKTR